MELFFDSTAADEERRVLAYKGDIFLYGASGAGYALCEFARDMLEQAFHPLDPRTAQHSLPVEEFAAILADLKPAFIHHDESKRLLQALLLERGCDLDATYFDVPRLRSSTTDGYLTSGIAYAFHPHRDTWYSAPSCQLNWWLPIYPMRPQSGMVIHPLYWGQPVRNSSRNYDYARWISDSRFSARNHLHQDTRQQPEPEQALNLGAGVVLNGEPGSVAIFSAAHLHASAENRSGECRYSMDFRTVHFADVASGRGAPNVDSACSGTNLGDYLRGVDFAHISNDWISRYNVTKKVDGG